MEKASHRIQRSPKVLTGCISSVSFIEEHDHSFLDALKEYAVHYAETQSYLADDEWQIVHDYTLIGESLNEPDNLLLGDDGEPAMPSQISDDDIDRCGYMGWLRH